MRTNPATVYRSRLVVLAAALLALAVKLYLAATTKGTNDAFHFQDFATTERQWGPVLMYAHPMYPLPPYNHPPLVGWLLGAVNLATGTGLPFRFVFRAIPSATDVIAALVVFGLIRQRASLRTATLAGCVVALSPVLIIISGYHANTDPLFGTLALLSFAVLVHTSLAHAGWGAVAGLLWAASVSIKLVPVVTLPLLLVLAWRRGNRWLPAFLAGAALVFLVVWLPVAITVWQPFKTSVLQYNGYYGGNPNGHSQWGVIEIVYALGPGRHAADLLAGPGRYLIVLVSAGLPAVLVWRRPALATQAFGLSLATFLLLNPAGATQYLSWAAVPTVLISVWGGLAYNLAAGAWLTEVYGRWNGFKPPWRWDRAVAQYWSLHETQTAIAVWLILLAVILAGLWRWYRAANTPPPVSVPDPTALAGYPLAGAHSHQTRSERS